VCRNKRLFDMATPPVFLVIFDDSWLFPVKRISGIQSPVLI
jgi:hypothetical protein